METKEYRTINKETWGGGPWQDEPDKMQFKDEATGLSCLIVRGPSGALCGYVGVAEGHPAYGQDYSDVRSSDGEWIEVHGGLTFANKCQPSNDESRGICHVPGEGEPDHVWWLGFDCAHPGDVCPSYAHRFGSFESFESYKDVRYVRAEITSLARQLAAIV